MATDEATQNERERGDAGASSARAPNRTATEALPSPIEAPAGAPAGGAHGLAHGHTMLPDPNAPSTGKAPRPDARDAADPLEGTVIADRYRLFERVGVGGMGAVYRGEHITLHKRVAVKFLHAEMSRISEVVARFEREARAAANLDHANVVATHDFGKTPDGLFFLVMEFIEGQSLRDLLDAEGRLMPSRAMHIGRHIAAALNRAHKLGIVHRDLKPENVVLVEREGDADFAKVIDFGIAKVPPGALGGTALTQAGMVFGTPDYMAPEQALGANVDHRADLYAFGVMLFEMLTGRRPFEADDVMVLLGKHMTAPPPAATATAPPGALPPTVDAVLARMLAKSPSERYPSVIEAMQSLEAALGMTPAGLLGTPPLGIMVGAPAAISGATGPQIALSVGASGSLPSLSYGTASSLVSMLPGVAPLGTMPPSDAVAPPTGIAPSMGAGAAGGRGKVFATLLTGYRELRQDRPRHRLVVGGLAAMAAVAVLIGLATRPAPMPVPALSAARAGIPLRSEPAAPAPSGSQRGRTNNAPSAPNAREVPATAVPAPGGPAAPPPPAPSDIEINDPMAPAAADRLPPQLAAQLAAYRARPEVAPLLAAHGRDLRPAIAAFEQTRASTPGDPIVSYLLGTMYARTTDGTATALERYLEAIQGQPGFAHDRTLLEDVVGAYARTRRPPPAAEAMLTGPLVSTATPYLLDVVNNARQAGARTRAVGLLLSPAYRLYADETVRGLIQLSRAHTCQERLAPVQQLHRAGDARALPYLRRIRIGQGCGFFGLGACNPCLTEELPAAIRAIQSRGR